MVDSIVIVGSGEDILHDKVVGYCKNADYIIASDGGYDTLMLYDIMPNELIGDMDSIIEDVVPDSIKIIKYNRDKDKSDSELALLRAFDLYPKNIYLLGMTGSYFDHSYANIITISKYFNNNVNIEIITQNSAIFCIKKSKIFYNKGGRRCSLFPITKLNNLKLEGFKYKFNKTKIEEFDFSLSNIITDDIAHITVSEGVLFCILFDKGYS